MVMAFRWNKDHLHSESASRFLNPLHESKTGKDFYRYDWFGLMKVLF